MLQSDSDDDSDVSDSGSDSGSDDNRKDVHAEASPVLEASEEEDGDDSDGDIEGDEAAVFSDDGSLCSPPESDTEAGTSASKTDSASKLKRKPLTLEPGQVVAGRAFCQLCPDKFFVKADDFLAHMQSKVAAACPLCYTCYFIMLLLCCPAVSLCCRQVRVVRLSAHPDCLHVCP